MERILKRKGKKYYYYDQYDTRQQALVDAKRYKKKDKSKYIIITFLVGYPTPTETHVLYLTNVINASHFLPVFWK